MSVGTTCHLPTVFFLLFFFPSSPLDTVTQPHCVVGVWGRGHPKCNVSRKTQCMVEESTLSATRNNFPKLHLIFKGYNQSAQCIWLMGSSSTFAERLLSPGFWAEKLALFCPQSGVWIVCGGLEWVRLKMTRFWKVRGECYQVTKGSRLQKHREASKELSGRINWQPESPEYVAW